MAFNHLIARVFIVNVLATKFSSCVTSPIVVTYNPASRDARLKPSAKRFLMAALPLAVSSLHLNTVSFDKLSPQPLVF